MLLFEWPSASEIAEILTPSIFSLVAYECLAKLIQPDEFNGVIRILDRVLSGNQNEDITPENFKTID